MAEQYYTLALDKAKPTMVRDWRSTTLGECGELISDFASPSDLSDSLYIGLEHIGEGTLSLLGRGAATDVTSTKAQFRRGDILFGKLRPYLRKVVRAPANGLCSTDIWVVRARDGVDQGYLYYCMASQQFSDYATAGSEGTRMPRAIWDYVSRYVIALPPVPEQRAIAHFLGTLDAKIELNRLMNNTLEAMARSLFKSWFVDIDPVRAKVDGRWKRGESLPGLPANLYDLFPHRLVDSELGKTPEGWKVGTVGNIVSRKNERVGGRSAIVLSAISSGKLIPSDSHFRKRVYSKGISNYLAVQQWDTAYNPSRINIGSIGMLKEPILGAVSPVYVVASPKPAYRWYLEFTLGLEQTKEWIATLATGSVRQSLSYADFASIPCVIPPSQVVERFNQQWERFRAILLAHDDENYILTAQRNALLPKLLSGELKADRLVRMPNGQAL